MSPSELIGWIIPGLHPWDWDPWKVGVFVLLINLGAGLFLHLIEGQVNRRHWKAFLWGESIGLPLMALGAAAVLEQTGQQSEVFVHPAWHVALIVTAGLTGLIVERNAVRDEVYTVEEELTSPSKVWHTIVLVFLIYMFLSAVPAVLTTLKPLWAVGVLSIGLGIWVYTMKLDAESITYDIFPRDAHIPARAIVQNWKRIRENGPKELFRAG